MAKRFRGTPMALSTPDVGSYLSTLSTPEHKTIKDIVIFVLNNHDPYKEVHVHRNQVKQVLNISKKTVGQTGNGMTVQMSDPLYNKAVSAAASK